MNGLLLFLLAASAIFFYAIEKFVCEEKMFKIINESELSSAKKAMRKKKDDHNAIRMHSNLQSWIKE